ncbi:SDR family NAD(P)-dependent oxidoreductase [Staphylococcus intermedius]|uniref:Short-chain dehydrogenase/reductase family oxidoreductase n=1 Tax=Staphylococcus intermedius NCTC 11048 TaxID=1141106 RepID=A0A380G8N1_STAIN|nr:SDR family NAD(P)-dependent oxidoreductase [Staphylococcus intermedius]PCF64862.1 short-chain dehydrogenase [Staphylococcus intermedius]PCF80472.1 short-chain dehydrogenase [Staphylococcus intermedius]PCF81822.1 short-chain dehydrogenase [Staphylococcus intermedius]PCF88159.1 short-chain dehydrogenase [Staphylococcus intermedius]PNZ53221.1 KR domain-containing protein [Staphylococcus intermedius NCTC 11048]
MKQKHFLITGSTSGLGYALTHALISAHYSITLLVRDVNKAKSLFPSSDVQIIQCDLTNESDVLEITRAFNSQTHFDGIVHCAGLGYFKGLLEHTSAEILHTYQVNVIHFSMLINQCAPYLSNHASIVGISSQAASATQPYAAHYGGSKAALNHVLNALPIEQPQWHVLNVNVGPIATPFHTKADPSGQYAHKMKKIMLNPEQLAEKIVRAIQHRQQELNEPQSIYWLLKLYQLAPRLFEKVGRRFFLGKKR